MIKWNEVVREMARKKLPTIIIDISKLHLSKEDEKIARLSIKGGKLKGELKKTQITSKEIDKIFPEYQSSSNDSDDDVRRKWQEIRIIQKLAKSVYELINWRTRQACGWREYYTIRDNIGNGKISQNTLRPPDKIRNNEQQKRVQNIVDKMYNQVEKSGQDCHWNVTFSS